MGGPRFGCAEFVTDLPTSTFAFVLEGQTTDVAKSAADDSSECSEESAASRTLIKMVRGPPVAMRDFMACSLLNRIAIFVQKFFLG